MALETTVAGPNADSYGSLTEADSYFDNKRLNSDAWDDALQADQEQAMRYATIMLDQLDYVGYASTDTQALKWPRYANEALTELIRNYAINTIPAPIKYAQFEIALWLLETGGSGVAVSAGTVESVQIGDAVSVKYAQPTSGETTTSGETGTDYSGLPLQAVRYLKGLRQHAFLA